MHDLISCHEKEQSNHFKSILAVWPPEHEWSSLYIILHLGHSISIMENGKIPILVYHLNNVFISSQNPFSTYLALSNQDRSPWDVSKEVPKPWTLCWGPSGFLPLRTSSSKHDRLDDKPYLDTRRFLLAKVLLSLQPGFQGKLLHDLCPSAAFSRLAAGSLFPRHQMKKRLATHSYLAQPSFALTFLIATLLPLGDLSIRERNKCPNSWWLCRQWTHEEWI